MICDDIVSAADGDYNDDDIDDDGNLIMHDYVYRDDDECDDHRHASMCQFVLWRIFHLFSHDFDYALLSRFFSCSCCACIVYDS